jgi:transcriptional regulator with XRE-family HTH domain
MLTPLGKYMRKLRIDRGERIYDLAQSLGVTSSFISAIELGNKTASTDLLGKVIAHYRLDQAGAAELREAAKVSTKDVKIELKGQSDKSRELAVAFARQFPTLDETKIAELLGLLTREEKNERHGN